MEQTNTTEHLQIQAVQTQRNQPGQTELEQAQAMALPQTQDKTTEKLFAESIAVISHERQTNFCIRQHTYTQNNTTRKQCCCLRESKHRHQHKH